MRTVQCNRSDSRESFFTPHSASSSFFYCCYFVAAFVAVFRHELPINDGLTMHHHSMANWSIFARYSLDVIRSSHNFQNCYGSYAIDTEAQIITMFTFQKIHENPFLFFSVYFCVYIFMMDMQLWNERRIENEKSDFILDNSHFKNSLHPREPRTLSTYDFNVSQQ